LYAIARCVIPHRLAYVFPYTFPIDLHTGYRALNEPNSFYRLVIIVVFVSECLSHTLVTIFYTKGFDFFHNFSNDERTYVFLMDSLDFGLVGFVLTTRIFS
jgi:hypothetical protein